MDGTVEAIVIKESDGTKIPIIRFTLGHELIPVQGSKHSKRAAEIVEEIKDFEYLYWHNELGGVKKKVIPGDKNFGSAVAQYCREAGLPKANYERTGTSLASVIV